MRQKIEFDHLKTTGFEFGYQISYSAPRSRMCGVHGPGTVQVHRRAVYFCPAALVLIGSSFYGTAGILAPVNKWRPVNTRFKPFAFAVVDKSRELTKISCQATGRKVVPV